MNTYVLIPIAYFVGAVVTGVWTFRFTEREFGSRTFMDFFGNVFSGFLSALLWPIWAVVGLLWLVWKARAA